MLYTEFDESKDILPMIVLLQPEGPDLFRSLRFDHK